MILWPIFALMTLAAVFAVWWPLARRQKPDRSGSDVAVYRDQLDEIDRDQAASRIGGVEAEAARVEVSRRLIAAAETAKAASAVAVPGPAGRIRWATRAAAIILLPLGAGITYLSLGSPTLVPVSVNAAADGIPGGLENAVARIETYLASNPGDGRGWELLAPVYARLGRFDDAVNARRHALEIFGADPVRLGNLGEAITMTTNGVVTPEAKGLFERANAADPADVMAQFYLGLNAKQEGRRDEAVKRWTALMSAAPQGAPWLPLVKNAIAEVDESGPSLSSAAVAPPASASASASASANANVAPPGPNASQVTAASQMAPGERNAMIEGMVARLAQRMAENGSDVDGWLRLIKAYSVLGERDKALTAAANARTALAGNDDHLRRIGELAKQLGLEGS
jgi:cytochrome c-type biogenesis protein CcmH